jgi:hypothetical protein
LSAGLFFRTNLRGNYRNQRFSGAGIKKPRAVAGKNKAGKFGKELKEQKF